MTADSDADMSVKDTDRLLFDARRHFPAMQAIRPGETEIHVTQKNKDAFMSDMCHA